MAQPVITVVIPVFNGEAFVRDALESVVKQSLPPREVIVVDDGSTDATFSVCKEWESQFPQGNLRVLTGPNAGPSVARNRAILESRGDAIAFLDADDVWTTDHLAVLVPGLSHEPLPGLIFSDALRTESICVMDPIRKRMLARSEPAEVGSGLFRISAGFREILFDTYAVHTSTLVVPRTAFAAVGLFDRTVRYAEDLDLVARLAACGPVLWYGAPTARCDARIGSLGAARPGPDQELWLAQVLSRIGLYDQDLSPDDREALNRAVAAAAQEAAYGASDGGLSGFLEVVGRLHRWTGRRPTKFWRLLIRACLHGR